MIAAGLIVVIPVAAWLARKPIVAWALQRGLTAAGLAPASFKVRAVDFRELRITELSIGAGPWLTVGELDVTYSISDLSLMRVKTIDVREAHWTVKAQGGSIDWGFTPKSKDGPSGPIALKMPFERLTLHPSKVTLILDDATHEVPVNAQVTPTSSTGIDGRVELVAMGRPIAFTARAASTAEELTVDVDGRADLKASPAGVVTDQPAVSAANSSAPPPPPVQFQAKLTRSQSTGSMKANINGTVLSLLESMGDTEIAAARADFSARAEIDGNNKLTSMVSSLSGQGVRVGDLQLADVQTGARMQSPETVELTSFSAIVGDGGTLDVAPFTLELRKPSVRTQVSISNVSMQEWMPIVTRGRASGEGRVSGEIEVTLDLGAAAGPRIDDVAGHLRADPQYGFIQVADAEKVGELLDAQDPRFATDEVMRPVRDKIVSALQDFAFNQFTVDLSRRESYTVALARLSGFGRRGQDPQGINLTLDLRVDDDLVDLASHVTALSKMRRAARGALDRFFGPPDAEPGSKDEAR